MNHLPAALKVSDPHLFAVDFKFLSKETNWLKLQSDLDTVDNLVKESKMSFAMDNCFKVIFRGDGSKFFLQGVSFTSTKMMKDLGVYVSDNLSCYVHISARLKKASMVFYLLKKNISYKLQATGKLGNSLSKIPTNNSNKKMSFQRTLLLQIVELFRNMTVNKLNVPCKQVEKK